MAQPILLKRRGLAFPGGLRPGFDPNHVCAANTIFSAVHLGSLGFINLVPGFAALNGTISGTPSDPIDGIIGPSRGTGTNYTTQFTSAAQGTADGTAAAIIRTGVSDNCGIFQIATANGGPQLADFSGLLFWSNPTQDLSSGIALADNTPYFVLVSNQSATGVTNFLVRNLNTGVMQTATATIVGANAAGNSGFTIGGEFKYGTFFDGRIAAVSYSQSYYTLPQLLVWGADPWAFWYPTPISAVAFDPAWAFAAAGGGGATLGAPMQLLMM